MTDLLLAHDVSWRPLIGPRPWVQLELYGPRAEETARDLGMVIEGRMAYLTEATPDLAERRLNEHEQPIMRGVRETSHNANAPNHDAVLLREVPRSVLRPDGMDHPEPNRKEVVTMAKKTIKKPVAKPTSKPCKPKSKGC